MSRSSADDFWEEGYSKGAAAARAQCQAEIETLRLQLARKNRALDHARVRFLCIADEAEKAGDEASWAMAAVDADRMILALSDETGKP